MTDAELVQRWKFGDEAALEMLLNRYEQGLFGYLYRMLGNRHEAEDALQEALVRAIRGLARYREQGQFKSWIFRIAQREGLRSLRSGKRRNLRSLDAEPIIHLVDNTQPMAGESVATREQVEHIRGALDALPDHEREVVFLRVYSGLQFREIAEVVGCPLNTALARMRRAVIRLREFLEREVG